MKSEPAFPVTAEQSPSGAFPAPGMTLRDYFAAKALHGLISCPNSYGHKDEFAKHSYEYADAMLTERNRNER